MITLRSPLNEDAQIVVPSAVKHLETAFNGSVGSNKGDEYPIKDNIIDLLGPGPKKVTLAQQTNFWSITSSVYEEYWRKNSLSMMSGEEFPLEKEMALLNDWVNVAENEVVIDLGCSTGLYARAIQKTNPKAEVIALDFSRPMLEKTREMAINEGRNLYLLQADAAYLPFSAGKVDAIVCGGTLNEFSDPIKVLYETRRVIKKNGTVFFMFLLTSEHWMGRIAQKAMELSGLSFWTKDDAQSLFKRAGFIVENFEQHEIVAFAKLRPD